VIPADLPVLAQAKAGTPIRFEQITLKQADTLMADPISAATLLTQLSTLVRDPAEISDLLSYQLISGAITGYED
jgi:allophanate hydrolase